MSSITEYEWVSAQTGRPVDEEWHLFLKEGLYDHYPTTYKNPTEEAEMPYLLRSDIAWGYSDATFTAGPGGQGVVGVNVNNSPNFKVWLGGTFRQRPVYVQMEFSYNANEGISVTDLLSNPMTRFNRTKRKLESILSRPRLLYDYGITFIDPRPSVLQDGRAFTNFGMIGTLQPQFLGTLQDNYKWRYILLYTAMIDEVLT